MLRDAPTIRDAPTEGDGPVRMTIRVLSLMGFFIIVGGAASGAYEVAPVTDGGNIAGKISFTGEVQAPKVFKIEKNPEVCGAEDRELYEVRVTDGALADVVLVLEGVEKGKPYASFVLLGPPPGTREYAGPGESAEFPGTDIRPKTCIFGAFTGVVADGSVLRFNNQDNVKHSPHTYEVKGRVRNSMHNKDLEGESTLELEIKFKKATAKVIKLECDQHNHMQNWFYRIENPYFAFSGEDGSFEIDQIPPGAYKLIAWHPILGEQEQEVTIESDGTLEVAFEFTATRRRTRR